MHDSFKNIEFKATLDAATWTGAQLAGPVSRPMRLMVQDLMPQVPAAAAGISYLQLTSMAATPAAGIAAGAAKTDAGFVGTNKAAKVVKAAFWQKMGDEFYNDAETFNGYIENFMLLGLAKAIEAVILAEFVAADIPALSGAVGETIAKAKGEIYAEGFEPDGVVMAPGLFQTVGGPPTGGVAVLGYGEPSEIGKPYFDRLLNMPVVVSSAIGTGKALVGAFGGGSILFKRTGPPSVSVTNTDQDDFVKNLTTIRVEQRIAVAILALPAFREITVS